MGTTRSISFHCCLNQYKPVQHRGFLSTRLANALRHHPKTQKATDGNSNLRKRRDSPPRPPILHLNDNSNHIKIIHPLSNQHTHPLNTRPLHNLNNKTSPPITLPPNQNPSNPNDRQSTLPPPIPTKRPHDPDLLARDRKACIPKRALKA